MSLAVKLPRWKRTRIIGSANTTTTPITINVARRIHRRYVLSVWRTPSQSPAATMREKYGRTAVPRAREPMPRISETTLLPYPNVATLPGLSIAAIDWSITGLLLINSPPATSGANWPITSRVGGSHPCQRGSRLNP